jgi:hypothetical protein
MPCLRIADCSRSGFAISDEGGLEPLRQRRGLRAVNDAGNLTERFPRLTIMIHRFDMGSDAPAAGERQPLSKEEIWERRLAAEYARQEKGPVITSASEDLEGPRIKDSDRIEAEEAKEVLERFRTHYDGIRLVYDFGTGKITGIATCEPGTREWRITRLETPAEEQFREAGINLLTDLVAQATSPALDLPSDLDDLVEIAQEAVDPARVTLKLCNAAVQALAHHVGLSPIAPALGKLAEQTLAPLVAPKGGPARAVKDMQVLDVAYDTATGRWTPAVQDFTLAELADVIKDKTTGISQAELDKIEETIRLRQQP